MLEYKINRFIKLRLEKGKTIIYINNKPFKQCKYVLIKKRVNDLKDLLEIESIDDLAQQSIDDLTVDLEHSLERAEEGIINIPIEDRFWVHCSNLQVWAENNYNTRLIHSNLAFPLLKRLTEVGDFKAANLFKFEILKRFIDGSDITREFLIEEKYLDHLGEEEFRSVLPIKELSKLEKLEKDLKVSFSFAKDLYYIAGIDGVEPDNLYYYDKLKKANIVALRIYKPDMKRIPEIITDLKELKYLTLSHNDSEHLPKFIGDLKKLKCLDLACNNLETIPESFKYLDSLKELDLWANNFKEVPEVLMVIKSLERIYLRGNPINDFPDRIGKLKKKKDNNYTIDLSNRE